MKEIQRTKNYSIFKKKPENRDLDSRNLVNIVSSMRVRNLLMFNPILVDGKMQVIDGQHRLEAAKQLGEEVFYVVDDLATDEEMVLMNNTGKQWDMAAYINFHISKGNLEYLKLREAAKERGMAVHEFLRYISGGRHRFNKDFKLGNFKFFCEEDIEVADKTVESVKTVTELLKRYIFADNRFLDSRKFKIALFSFLRRKDVEVEKLLRKIESKSSSIHKCADSRGYYIMLRDIYNWNNKSPIKEEETV